MGQPRIIFLISDHRLRAIFNRVKFPFVRRLSGPPTKHAPTMDDRLIRNNRVIISGSKYDELSIETIFVNRNFYIKNFTSLHERGSLFLRFESVNLDHFLIPIFIWKVAITYYCHFSFRRFRRSEKEWMNVTVYPLISAHPLDTRRFILFLFNKERGRIDKLKTTYTWLRKNPNSKFRLILFEHTLCTSETISLIDGQDREWKLFGSSTFALNVRQDEKI